METAVPGIVEVREKLKVLFQRHFAPSDYVLVDINAVYCGGALNISLKVDRPRGGITINECADINRSLARVLETDAAVAKDYLLEVSSPGVDRPLISEDDFKRNLGRKMAVYLKDRFQDKLEIQGVLTDITGGNLVFSVEGGEVSVPVIKVRKGKQLILRRNQK